MKLLKRCVSVCLALAMVVTGFNLDGFALKARAAANEDENAYMGVMLTEEEFNKFSYTEAQVEWDDDSVNENGLSNYRARYVAEGATIDDVLQQLKGRNEFFYQEGEDGYNGDAAAGADLTRTNEGYYAVIVGSIAAEEQTVTELAGVKGVFFDSHYFNNLPDDEEPNESTEWYAYDHKNLTMEVQTALTFRGQYNNLTLKYKDNDYPVTLRGDVAGTVKGIAEEGIESRLYTFMSSAYGISGFDKTLFLPTSWVDEDSGDSGQGRGMYFCKPTAEGADQISFGDICAAEVDEESGLPREIAEGTETSCGVDIDIYYHEGYIPTISGTSNLGIWKWKNPDNEEEEETGNQNIALHYYEENGGHTPQSGEKVVNYGSAAAWAGNEIWCDSHSDDIDGKIDAEGRFFDYITEMQFSVCRYENQDEYESFYEDGRWAENWLGESATIEGALQALTYDSELNSDAYYMLNLTRDWERNENTSLETELGALSVPSRVKGLRLIEEEWGPEDERKKITGVLDTVNIGAGTELDLTGWYRGTGADNHINIEGNGTLGFDNARINGNVDVKENVTVSSRNQTAVASLTGMKTLNLSDQLTIENELGFAEDGQLNIKEEFRDAGILARSGAKIKIPNLDCIYDSDNQYGNRLEIFEEVNEEGAYPEVTFSGARELGKYREMYHMRYRIDEEEQEEGPEYEALYPICYYEGENEEDYGLIILDDTVYRIHWNNDEDEPGTDKITLDGKECTLVHEKLEETKYNVEDVTEDIHDNEVKLIPYDASAVSRAAGEDDSICLAKDPYTDNDYGIDVQAEWNCKYHVDDDEMVEYYLSGTSGLTGIVAEYGEMQGEEGDRHYEGRCLCLTVGNEYPEEEEGGKYKYALFVNGDEGQKSTHYVSSSILFEPETDGEAFWGVMLTEEEFNEFSYTEAGWNDPPNYEARYSANSDTVDELLEKLKARDKIFIQENEEGYDAGNADGADLTKPNEGYYAVVAQSKYADPQNVTNLKDVGGVFFDTGYYEDANKEWHPYGYKNLTVDVGIAALTFQGYYSDITLNYTQEDYAPVTLRGEVAGTVNGVKEGSDAQSSLYLFGASVYGISGFDKTLFLPRSWQDGGESGENRWMDFRGTGSEEISFGDICAAEVGEDGLPQEIEEGTETQGGVDINILYHEDYIPTISGTSNLGIWKEQNNDGQEETRNQGIGLHYYNENDGEENNEHRPQSGEKVVNYGSAEAWAGNEIWCDSYGIDGCIDARGMFFKRTETQFRVSRYENKEEYESYYETGRWGENWLGESATIEGALQALTYDSKLNSPKAYYTLVLARDDWNNMNENSSWETELGDLSIPNQVKGLRLTAEGTENGSKIITGILGTVNIGAEKDLDLTGWYRGKGEKITVSGQGTLSLTNARINGNVVVEGDVTVSSRQETAVASLTGMKTLNLLSDGLTIEKELGFAEGGELNATEELCEPHILARSGARVEIPDVNCVYDTTNNYGNLLTVYEEVKDGERPTLIFSGERNLGDRWDIRYLSYTKDNEEPDENGKPEHMWVAPLYYYVPEDEDGNEQWEDGEYQLIISDGKVYRIEWDNDSQDPKATNQITFDGEPCTFLYQKFVETDYEVGDIRKDVSVNEVVLDTYEFSEVEKSAEKEPDIGVLKDPYTDNSYDSGIWMEWSSVYNSADEIAEYYVSGITDLTGIMSEYSQWVKNEEGRDEFAGGSIRLYPVQKYLKEKEDDDDAFTDDDVYTEEDGVKKYVLFMYGDEGPVKSSHYVSEIKSITSLEDSAKIEITTQSHTYTGSAISEKPVVKWKSDSSVLKEGRDYTLSYKNNIHVGNAAEVTVTGRGAYTGTVTKTFSITAKALKDADVSLDADSAEYTGAEIKPQVTVTDGDKTLTEGTDYELAYEDNIHVGTAAQVKVTGKGNYSGTVPKTFTITAKALKDADVSLAAESAEYTGSAITPGVTVKDGDKTLTEGTDYELAYEDNINVGTAAKVTVTGKGNYSGTVPKTFTITEKKPTTVELSTCTISLAPESAEYTGSAITPTVTVKDGEKTLTKDTDYTLTYENNINAGTAAKVTVTGKGNYTGEVTKTFTITAKTIANATVVLTPSNYYYNGKACKPKVTVKLNGKELKAEDYSVTYSKNTNIGKASVTITGKNNYTGSTRKTFNITVKKGSSYTVGAYKYKITSASEVSFAGLKSKKTTKVSVPNTVKIGGKNFKVTAIDAKALKKTGITSVTVGNNVKTIGNSAFEGCSKLIKVTIGTGVTKLGTSTFKSCKKLGSITIKSAKLKTVGKNALKGIKSNAKIKVPSKKRKDYKKLLKGKGQASAVKIK